MADFRKLFLALIAGALLFTAVASAQPYACNANAVPTLGRSEGIAEPTGDVLLVCEGSIPSGGILANIRYRLTQNITTDIESGSGVSPTVTEALLILDEGANGYRGPQSGGYSSNQQNVYQAIRISDDEIEWTGVWLAAQGSNAFKTIRLTNIRGNAQAAGDFGTLFATVNIVSPTSVPVNNAVLRVMDTRPGMTFTVSGTSFKNCVSPGSSTIKLRFNEGFAASFKPKGTAGSSPNNVPGGGYLNESGFAPSSLVSGSLTGSPGQASHGTRLMARLKNIPAGVTLTVPVRVVVKDSSDNIHLIAQLVESPEADGGSGTVSTGSTTDPSVVIPSSGLVVYEVKEIDATSYATQERVEVAVGIAFSLPGPLGTGTANGTLAPISTTYTMSRSGYEPRFVDKASDTTVLTIAPCRTIILFPYVTNQAGFDTGIAISNTTKDPLGTPAQSGTCTINYYGNTNGSTGPVAQTSPEIGSGAHLAFMLSGGGGVFAYNGGFTACASGACVAPLFQGYVIAICNFQFAHGYAFISDLGVDTIAQGYLAMVIPDRICSGIGCVPRLSQDSSLGAAANEGEQLGN